MVTTDKALPLGVDFDRWLTRLPSTWTPVQIDLVRRAYGLTTARGIAVADLLVDLRMDHEVVAAALLREAVSAGQLAPDTVVARSSPTIAGLMEGVGKLEAIGDLHRGGNAQAQLETLRKMLLAMALDVRVVVLKLALRLVELRGLGTRPAAEQQRLARETLDIFTPLANRLGMARLRWEMEDLTLRYLDPVAYKQLARALDERRRDREHYIAEVVAQLDADLRRAGIRAEVSGRAKHIYSIWRKMQRKSLPFEEIFDIHAVRVMVDSVADCYAALGVAHAQWNHIQQEFDDYIANPKRNGYQSLHTAVVGPAGKILEVQIRTREMHERAELGIAAHWRYKEGAVAPGEGAERQIAWLRQMLLEWKDETADAGEFLDRLQAENLQDRVYAVTPKGTVVDLPSGATPLDFAYAIHTEVGHRCRGAKVNGRIVPLSYELKTGERVEILTAKEGGPSRDWLSPHLGYLKTSRAQGKVRQWFKVQDQEKSIQLGRATLEREFKRLDVHLKPADLQKVAEQLNFTKPDELFAALGYGSVTIGQVVAKAQALILPPPPETLPVTRRARPPSGKEEIAIRGVGKLLTQIATCCKPVPYEPIVGFITRGRGVSIHRQDCVNVLELIKQHPERIIDVSWSAHTAAAYTVDVHIEAYDRPGLLRDITSTVANEQINVLAANTLTDPDTGVADMRLTLQISDIEQLSRTLDKIAQLPTVIEAHRTGSYSAS